MTFFRFPLLDAIVCTVHLNDPHNGEEGGGFSVSLVSDKPELKKLSSFCSTCDGGVKLADELSEVIHAIEFALDEEACADERLVSLETCSEELG
mmetsp:Transcript_33416/g.50384  ORF Transcript_33416/g.50384 Transcript_33416/m.50384 type:complete len:94 (-) Transcript_33416:100-381(-)